MINKQNLWFITLFSLILVLGIYYVSMGDETISVLAGNNDVSEVVEVSESDVIVALQVEDDEEVLCVSVSNTTLVAKSLSFSFAVCTTPLTTQRPFASTVLPSMVLLV